MPKERLSMRKLSEMLRLDAAGLSARQIARSCDVARSTVADHLARMKAAGLKWPLPTDFTEADWERRLFDGPGPVRSRDVVRPLADWAAIHKELARKGVTLKLLWQEYRQVHSDGYHYSQFCEHYQRWAKSLDVCLRQTYRAGERLFVDYAGATMPVHDPIHRQVDEAQIFVAALGASHYLYAEATRSQQLPDWIESHIRTYEHLHGVPEITVSDNLKSGVSRACRYDPDINPTYQDMATHYATAIIPARPRRPQDKAKVESGVQVVEREVLAPLRHHTFFSLAELNQAITARLQEVNRRPFQKLKVSRNDLFLEIDQPALKPLPSTRYEYAEFHKARVNID
jgi:transposase